MALSSYERTRRYRRSHPEKWAEQMRNYNYRSGAEPGDFGGHKRGRKPWDAEEEQRVIDHAVPDSQLAEELDRTVKAVTVRRCQILKRTPTAAPPRSGGK